MNRPMNHPRRRNFAVRAIVALLVLLGASLAGGCRVIEYGTPDGRTLRIVSFGNDTAIGKLDIATPEGGKLGLENVDSKARLADALAEMARRLPAP